MTILLGVGGGRRPGGSRRPAGGQPIGAPTSSLPLAPHVGDIVSEGCEHCQSPVLTITGKVYSSVFFSFFI